MLLARPKGFTLIELLVTVTVLAILASVALPLTQLTAQRQKEQELKENLREIRNAIDEYKRASDEGRIEKSIDETGYPKDLNSLYKGMEDKKSPTRQKLYFLRRIPRDPFCDCPERDANATWNKRSYASPPDSPQSGDDIYDVYSTSHATGINGIPYTDW